MSAPSNVQTSQLVKGLAEKRLATDSQLKLIGNSTANCKAKTPEYEATAQPRHGIRFVPSLNLAALNIRPRIDDQLLLWYYLRGIDTAGCGRLDQETTAKILTRIFNYKRQTVYKHLHAGDGVFWQRHASRKGRTIIVLNSLIRVARHLKADIRSRDRFIEVSSSNLPPPGQVQSRRALLYDTGAYRPYMTDYNPPISRKSLTEKTGVDERQQRRFDQIMEVYGTVRERTFAYYCDQSTGKLKKFFRLVQTERGDVLTYQLPNRYRTTCFSGSMGMLPKVARLLRAARESCFKGEATSGANHRRYYRSKRSFIKAALKGTATEGYYPSRSSNQEYILETV
jgi:hypothetical protein